MVAQKFYVRKLKQKKSPYIPGLKCTDRILRHQGLFGDIVTSSAVLADGTSKRAQAILQASYLRLSYPERPFWTRCPRTEGGAEVIDQYTESPGFYGLNYKQEPEND